MRRIVFMIFVLFLSSCGGGRRWKEITFYRYGDEFREILNNLVYNYWDESGDWRGDLEGDATAFAPLVLFQLYEAGWGNQYYDMALKTVEYEVSLAEELLNKGILASLDTIMKGVVGGPALVYGYEFTRKEEYIHLAKTGFRIGKSLLKSFPDLANYFLLSPVVGYGTLIYMGFEIYELTGEEEVRTDCVEMIWECDGRYYDDDGYYTPLTDWGEAVMMMALSKAYIITGEVSYLDRAEEVYATSITALWDSVNDGFFSDSSHRYKNLSGNNNFVWGLLEMYRATGKEEYLEMAERTIDYILRDLYENGIAYHHWEEGVGRADYFCTGCNFELLANILTLNNLLGDGKRP